MLLCLSSESPAKHPSEWAKRLLATRSLTMADVCPCSQWIKTIRSRAQVFSGTLNGGVELALRRSYSQPDAAKMLVSGALSLLY